MSALHIPLTDEHRERAIELCDLLASCAVSSREANWRGSYPLALHHVGEARLTLLALIPLLKRLAEHAMRPVAEREAA